MPDFLTSWANEGPLGYLAVAIASMIPWFELFSIPAGILVLGLDPLAVGAVALVSNLLPTVGIVWGWDRLSVWWERRNGRPLGSGGARSERGRKIFDRFGLPGLALQGPIISGIYLAVAIALGLGAARRAVVLWSAISISLWSVLLSVGSVLGLVAVR